ncbi:MAG: Gfo/Idh/MocA family protein [Shimia sp.]
MADTVRYGIIGCGMMGQEHIRNILLVAGAEVAALYDPVVALARAAQALAPGARIAASLDDLVSDRGVDALVIVSPNHLHIEQLTRIAELRDMPILCEKPLFTDAGQLPALEVFERDYGAPVWVAMEYRYMPPVALLREQVADVTGGVRMLSIREHRFPFLKKVGDWNRFNAQTGGTLVEKCCHFFDLMRLLLDSEPVRIAASGGQDVNHLSEKYGGRVPDIWDNAYVIADFASGARAMLELCMFAEGARYQEEIAAMGPSGKVECLVPGPGRFWPVERLGPAPVPRVIVSPRSPKGPREAEVPVEEALLEAGDHNGSTFYQHQKFNAVIRGEGEVEVTLRDGRRAVEMGLAAQRAAAEGISVRL